MLRFRFSGIGLNLRSDVEFGGVGVRLGLGQHSYKDECMGQ